MTNEVSLANFVAIVGLLTATRMLGEAQPDGRPGCVDRNYTVLFVTVWGPKVTELRTGMTVVCSAIFRSAIYCCLLEILAIKASRKVARNRAEKLMFWAGVFVGDIFLRRWCISRR